MPNINMPNHHDKSLEALLPIVIEILRQAKHICILTGAGISAESGIPTFRDKQTGLWANYRAEDLATIGAFESDPKLVWSWYQWRRHQVKALKPNVAHLALAKWQQNAATLGQTLTLITQNVDDLHEQAGSTVSHLHGHLYKNKCSQCDKHYPTPIDTSDATLVHCPHCNGYIRPDIVWFGEGLPRQAWHDAEQAAQDCDVFISIGTSSLVYPAAGLSSLAKNVIDSGNNESGNSSHTNNSHTNNSHANDAIVIEINPNSTHNPVVDIALVAKAGEIVPQLVDGIINDDATP